MKLYHFCSERHIESIKSSGLTLGTIPIPDEDGNLNGQFVQGCQWLTRNPDFQQSWADNEYSNLPYSRTDFRIEVSIPKSSRHALHKWEEVCITDPRLARAAKILNSFGDPENWYFFTGRIKPGWFRQIKKNPNSNSKSILQL